MGRRVTKNTGGERSKSVSTPLIQKLYKRLCEEREREKQKARPLYFASRYATASHKPCHRTPNPARSSNQSPDARQNSTFLYSNDISTALCFSGLILLILPYICNNSAKSQIPLASMSDVTQHLHRQILSFSVMWLSSPVVVVSSPDSTSKSINLTYECADRIARIQ